MALNRARHFLLKFPFLYLGFVPIKSHHNPPAVKGNKKADAHAPASSFELCQFKLFHNPILQNNENITQTEISNRKQFS